jgi:hypothetical protein
MQRALIFLLIIAIGAGTAAAAQSSPHPLVGRWLSSRETLTFFGSHEFAFGDEHGPTGRWTLRGSHLAFAIPGIGVTREAKVVRVSRDQLVLLERGRKQIYRRWEPK